jgi:ATP-dependent DNA ligase
MRKAPPESDVSKKLGSDRLVYYAFDILHLEIFDLRGCALLDRKRVLEALLRNVSGPIKYSEHLVEDGPNVVMPALRVRSARYDAYRNREN